MAGRAKENLLGGSLKYLFIYLKIRIFKCSYRIFKYIYIYRILNFLNFLDSDFSNFLDSIVFVSKFSGPFFYFLTCLDSMFFALINCLDSMLFRFLNLTDSECSKNFLDSIFFCFLNFLESIFLKIF